MKAVLIIIDGMEDRPGVLLKNQLLLPAGGDWRDGFPVTGRFRTTPPGRETDSQTCILTLLGLSPSEIPYGRAALEAAAVGLEAEEDELLFRCNLVEVDNGVLTSSCADAGDIASRLAEKAAQYPGCRLTYLGGFRFLMGVRGWADRLESFALPPPHQHLGEKVSDLLPNGEAGALLRRVSEDILRITGSYTLFPWSPGVRKSLPQWRRRHGTNAAMVAHTQVVRGIAAEMGLPCPVISGATGDTDTDLSAKREAALRLLTEHDLVIIHVGGADEASHRLDPREKADFLERVGRELVIPLGEAEPRPAMLVCSDHATLSESGRHHPMPVRFWMRREAADAGFLGELDGKNALGLLIDKEEW